MHNVKNQYNYFVDSSYNIDDFEITMHNCYVIFIHMFNNNLFKIERRIYYAEIS